MKANLLFTYIILLILCTSCHSEKAVVSETKKAPNILFLFADDQRFNTINALGNKEIITPNLDQLVNTGTSFTNAYIFGAMNGAVCAPSRGMLMTGRSIFQLNPHHANFLDMPDTLMPRTLASNGYQTFHTGKWHNGKKAFMDAFDAGSKIFFGGMFDQYTVPTYEFSADGNYADSLKAVQNIHSSELYANAAVEYLQKVDTNDPFMMYVAFQAPHDPRDVAQKYIDLTNTKKPALLEGESLVPILKGEKKQQRNSMIYAYKSNQRAYRKGDYKLVKYMVSGQRTNQLFNLKQDPWEVSNLYQQAEHQALIAAMEQEMQAQLTAFGDKALLTADNWGIEVLPRWIHNVSKQTIERLRGLAERERKLRGF